MLETFEDLQGHILGWAYDKGIFADSDPKSQLLKTVSKVGELADGINVDDEEEIIDALGDVLVTMIILADMKNLNLVDCLDSAYKVISGRTGKMVNGVFVKDV